MANGRLRIGISGWNYAGWRGDFYPDGLPHRRELEYASREFDSIEINSTFYSLKRPHNFEAWHGFTPEGFCFAIKGSRFLTHMKRLKQPRQGLANFLAQGLLRLGDKLGPMLWQFPQRTTFDDVTRERLDSFLELLPRDMESAAALAAEHGPQVDGRAWFDVEANHVIHHAVEVRHDSFRDPEFAALLRRHRVALVFSDAADWETIDALTGEVAYLRLHGSQHTYSSRYSDDEIRALAARIREWRRAGRGEEERARDVYVYFDNDQKAQAPRDARRLLAELRGDGATTAEGRPAGAGRPSTR